MRIRDIIQSSGATCQRWMWSWSYINEKKRTVIFLAWKENLMGTETLIFDEDWIINNPKKRVGYKEARENILRIENKGYTLKTLPVFYTEEKGGDSGIPKYRIVTGVITKKYLRKVGNKYYAFDSNPFLRRLIFKIKKFYVRFF